MGPAIFLLTTIPIAIWSVHSDQTASYGKCVWKCTEDKTCHGLAWALDQCTLGQVDPSQVETANLTAQMEIYLRHQNAQDLLDALRQLRRLDFFHEPEQEAGGAKFWKSKVKTQLHEAVALCKVFGGQLFHPHRQDQWDQVEHFLEKSEHYFKELDINLNEHLNFRIGGYWLGLEVTTLGNCINSDCDNNLQWYDGTAYVKDRGLPNIIIDQADEGVTSVRIQSWGGPFQIHDTAPEEEFFFACQF